MSGSSSSDTASLSSGQKNSPLDSGAFLLEEKDPELVNPDEKYTCPIHKGLLRNPVQTPCGHRLCRACVEVFLGDSDSKPCPVDDDDAEQEEVTRDNIFPDPGFLREIKNLFVYCSYKSNGCKEEVRFKDLIKHKAHCPFQPVLCKYSSRGCNDLVFLWLKSEHEQTCPYHPTSCRLCGIEFSLKDLKDHEENHCPEGIVHCPYSCGKKMKRREMDDHMASCPMKPGECQYKILGCHFQGDKEAVEEHEKDYKIHFETLVAYVCQIKMEQKGNPSSSNQAVGEKIPLLETMLKKLEKDHKLKHTGSMERIIALERQVEELKKELDEVKQQCADLKTAMEQISQTAGPSDEHNRQFSKLELKMAENDLRFQMIETASYDGTLLWKIRDFSIRRRDALQQRTVSLYSQPFYSGRFGYKMCARVYLNGDGIGKGTHVSLYFVVMKGEYDALLPWPFQLKISLVLLDQSPQKRHLRDEFLPDPNSTSFQRPIRAEMNVASGCPLFVAHSVIDNTSNQYVKDDMLFIKVSVDCSQLPPI